MPDLAEMGALQLTAAYAAGEVSPVEAVDLALARAAASQRHLNAFCALDPEGARAAAAASERRWRGAAALGPLDGVPVSVKDNIDVAGLPTRYGSHSSDAGRRAVDSPSVARLREAGAIVFGKTTLPEHAHKLSTESPLTGVTRNPWSLAHSPGGSSGGAAAAVAARIGPLALGTDGGGSIRMPAAWSGIFGFKPSFGRVPHHPRGTFALFSHVGPMTRNVADAAAMMDIIARPDCRDWYALPYDSASHVAATAIGLAGRRIAVSERLGLTGISVQADLLRALGHAARAAEAAGAAVDTADPPAVEMASVNHGIAWVSLCANVVERCNAAQLSLLDPSLLALAEGAAAVGRTRLLDAILGRGEVGHAVNGFFERFDLLLCPVFPAVAPSHDRIADGTPLLPRFTCWCNQTGLPAASVPAGLSADGLPLAVQIVGRQYADDLVLAAARVLEAALPALPVPPHA